jgi:hypothetical protein
MPPAITSSRQFFDSIRNAPDPVKSIEALCNAADPTYENDWIEFKQDPGIAGDSLKGIWLEALSGFANSGGGVIVWGVVAKKDPATNTDFASATKPVKNPAAFKSRLIELQRQGTDPPVPNVEIQRQGTDPPVPNVEIESYPRGSPAEGYVICHVPVSPYRPHRAETKGCKQYFIRAGDSFFVASVAQLRSLFFPQVQAVMQFEAELTATPYELSEDDMTTYETQVRVRNAGNGTARDGFLIVETNAGPDRPVDMQQTDFWSVMLPRDTYARKFAARLPIHPSSVVDVFRVVWRVPGRSRGGWGLASGGKDFILQFRFFADNQEPQASKLTVDLSQVRSWGEPKLFLAEPQPFEMPKL